MSIETFPEHSTLFTGAGSGVGRALAIELAVQGYQIIAGTRHEENFDKLADEILQKGGVEPHPFIANLADESAVKAALASLNLPEGEAVHYFAFAAEGLEPVQRRLLRIIAPLHKQAKQGEKIMVTEAESATQKIKELMDSDESQKLGLEVNYEGAVRLFNLLAQRGHIQKSSIIVTPSSSISHITDPDNPDEYKGPWFYAPIGFAKEKGVRETRALASEYGATHIDLVIPKIQGTTVGDLVDGLITIERAIEGVTIDEIVSIEQRPLVQLIISELNTPLKSGSRTVYVTEERSLSLEKPTYLEHNPFPYL